MSELSPYEDETLPGSQGVGLASHQFGETLLEAQKQSLEMVVRGAPLPEVLAYLTQVVEQQSRDEVVAAILLLDDEGRLYTGAAPSLPAAYNAAIDGLKAMSTVGTCSAAAATAHSVVTPDIEGSPAWVGLSHLPLALGLRAAWSQPIMARDGRVLGTFGAYFRDCREPTSLERRLVETLSQTAALAIERSRAETEMIQQRRMLDLALDAAEMGFWRYSFDTKVRVLSDRAQTLYAANAREVITIEDSLELLHPDDVQARDAALAAASDTTGSGRYAAEYRVKTRDGGWRWLSVWGLVEFEGEGAARRPISIVGASRDITEQKRADEHQRLLVNELNHRVKNTLAAVQSIAAQTLRTAPDLERAQLRIEERIQSLARAHDTLTSENWSGADLRQVVTRALEAFRAPDSPDIAIRGEPVRLLPAQALGLSLAVHELATNALKYGALSCEGGLVAIEWSVEGSALHFTWRETGGPAVEPPERRGFGVRLLERGLAGDLGGPTRLDYRPEGVVFQLTAAL